MNKINIKNIDPKEGFDLHEDLRNGASSELHPVKTSALLRNLVDVVNQLVEENLSIKQEIEKLQKDKAQRKTDKT